MKTKWDLVFVAMTLFVAANAQSLVKRTCSAQKQFAEHVDDANIILAATLSMRDSMTGGYGCGKPLISNMQSYEAIRYAINIQNNINAATGIKFGMKAYDSCASPVNALRDIQKLFPQTTTYKPYCTAIPNKIVLGLIGPFYSSMSMQVVPYVKDLGMPFVSPSATSTALSDPVKYPNFFRTAPSTSDHTRSIAAVFNEFQWKRLLVIYVDDGYSMDMYNNFLEDAPEFDICVSHVVRLPHSATESEYKTILEKIGSNSFVAGAIFADVDKASSVMATISQVNELRSVQWILGDMNLNGAMINYQRGVLVVQPKAPTLTGFRDYFVGLEMSPSSVDGNPWFKEWYELVNGCSLNTGIGNQCILKDRATLEREYIPDPYVSSAIAAVSVYAKVVEKLCPGNSGLCQALLQATPQDVRTALSGVDFTTATGERIRFDVNGDLVDMPAFSVLQYNNVGGTFSFKNVGEYINGKASITGQTVFYDAARDNALPQRPTVTCGSSGCSSCVLPSSHVKYHYTSGDVVIGSLINARPMNDHSLFSCGRSVESKLASMVAVQWAVGDFKRQNPTKLQGVSLGSLVADVCPTGAVAASFLNDLMSSSSEVVDNTGIPVFARKNIYGFVDDTDNMMAKAISQMLSQWKVPEIQAGATTSSIHSGGMYPYFSRIIPDEKMYMKALTDLLKVKGWMHVQILTMKGAPYEHMAKSFKAHAAGYGICAVRVSHFDDGVANVLNRITNNNEAHVVVTFGDAAHIKSLFDEIKRANKVNTIQIISGMPEWSTDKKYFDTTTSSPESAITLGLRQGKNNRFETYLSGLSRSVIASDRLLTSLFEVSNQCSLVIATRSKYARICSSSDSFTPFQGNAPYVIQAVNNMAESLHEIIADECGGPTYNGVCVKFQQSSDIQEKLAQKLKNSNGIHDGEASTDIVYYVIKNGVYMEFGEYDTTNRQVSMNANANNLLNSALNKGTACNGFCEECQYLYIYRDMVYKSGDFIIAGSFSASYPAALNLAPYQCGSIKSKNGPQFSTAMLYALDQVNSNKAPVSVKGLTIGGLALDHCGTDGRARMMVSDIYSGFLHQSMDVDENKILSWIIDGSGSARESAAMLDRLGVPIVSSDATSESLQKDYNNFYRTIQGDSTTAKFFIKMAKQLGFRYVQVVYSESAYGLDYLKTLATVAESEGICIKKSYSLSNTANAAANIVSQIMREKANVVILITGTSKTEAMFQAITASPEAMSSLLVMTPEASTDVVQRYGDSMTYPPISLQLQSPTPAEYRAYLDSHPVSNPFFAKWYMHVYQCNLKGYHLHSTMCSYPLKKISQDSDFKSSEFELATINAVYASVDALDRTLKEYCGQDYIKPCMAFYQAADREQRYIKNLDLVSFIDEGGNTFRFLQREGNVAFNILQYSKTNRKQEGVGSFGGVSLDLDNSFFNGYSSVVSQCKLPCVECINKGLNFSLTPGDIYLGGLFDVHQTSYDPFICGRIKTLHGFLLVEAFHYALQQVNAKDGQFKDILNGVTLGGVGLDACTSQVRGGQLVSNVYNGLTELTKGSLTVKAATIDTWIGTYHSSSSRYLARILNDLEIPQISYAAGSTDLSDQRFYPYFYRTVPSNKHQARAILAYLNEQDIRYIQVLYAGTSYGTSGKDELVKLAAEYKICVAQTVVYPDLGIASPERSKAVVASLIEKPAANMVVTFLKTDYINSVLRAVGLTDRARNKLRFLGSDVWADSQDAIEGASQYALDSVTLKLDADDVVQFENHINSKTLANSDNPWFEEYYQEILNCYTSPSNTLGFSRRCTTGSSIISSNRYQQDPNVLTVINSVYASAFAIHKTLTDLCGDGYQSVCEAYRANMKRRDAIRDNLASVEFTDPTNAQFKFVDREVPLNYRYNAIVSGGRQGIYYQQIGSYTTKSQAVSLPKPFTPSHPWQGGCDREDACAECPAIRDATVRYHFISTTHPIYDKAPVIVAFLDIHEQGVDHYRCGKLNMAGFQQLLTILVSINAGSGIAHEAIQGNEGTGSYRGIRLMVVDTCSNPVRVDQDLFGLLQGTGLCNTMFKTPDGVTITADNIGSVITSGDLNTMAASRLLEHLKVTHVSPDAKTPLLDRKMHLARTISPISGKMQYLTAFLKRMEWFYLDVIYEGSEAGYYPMHSFEYFAAETGLCLGSPLTIGQGVDNVVIDRLMEKLNGDRGSRVAVLLGGKEFYTRVLAAANRLDIAEKYVWVLAGEVQVDEAFVEHVSPKDQDIKVIAMNRIYNTLKGYTDALKLIQYTDSPNGNNRQLVKGWFEEFFQTVNECHMGGADKPMNAGKPECVHDTGVNVNNLMHDMHTVNMMTAMYAVAQGLHDFIEDDPTRAFSAGLNSKRSEIREKILAAALDLKAKDVTEEDSMFALDPHHRWWNTEYDVQAWMVNDKEATKKGDKDSLKTHLNMSSVCLENESEGFCGCNIDTALRAEMVVAPDFVPSNHRNYFKYDDDADGKPEQVYDWPVWAIVMAVLTGLGLLVTVVLFLVLLCAYPKKGGTSILGYMMVVGIIGIYAINFAFFLGADDDTCLVRRLLMGIVYTVCFAPLLIKAIDNWRYGHIDHAERRYSGISSSCALLMSAVAVVLIQCIIPVMWLILVHPTASKWEYGTDRLHDNWWCDPADDYDLGLVLSFSFVLFVVVLTGIFSALSYQTQTNSYESRWIMFASVATAGCFLVWMIVTTNAGPVYRDPTVAIANFANATILLLAIPLRKTVLMVQAKRDQNYKEPVSQNGANHYDTYSESYVNPGYELSDYDHVFMDKPSEF